MAALFLAGCGASSPGGSGSLAEGGGSAPGAPPVAQLDPSQTLQPVFLNDAGADRFYKIGPMDVLKVQVFQVDELNRQVQVSGAGTITLPLIGQLKAAGRSQQGLEAEIASRLRARYLQSPQVNVYIEEYNSQKITVTGAVKKPGVYPVKAQTSLLRAIASAEGLDTVADPKNIIIFREQAGNRYVARFDIEQINAGVARDPLLQNGDVVTVEASGFKTTLRDWSPALGFLSTSATFIGLAK
ncbi:MAG: polysaccharide biosynthesis/export family protein [Rhodoblastus sp.]